MEFVKLFKGVKPMEAAEWLMGLKKDLVREQLEEIALSLVSSLEKAKMLRSAKAKLTCKKPLQGKTKKAAPKLGVALECLTTGVDKLVDNRASVACAVRFRMHTSELHKSPAQNSLHQP